MRFCQSHKDIIVHQNYGKVTIILQSHLLLGTLGLGETHTAMLPLYSFDLSLFIANQNCGIRMIINEDVLSRNRTVLAE